MKIALAAIMMVCGAQAIDAQVNNAVAPTDAEAKEASLMAKPVTTLSGRANVTNTSAAPNGSAVNQVQSANPVATATPQSTTPVDPTTPATPVTNLPQPANGYAPAAPTAASVSAGDAVAPTLDPQKPTISPKKKPRVIKGQPINPQKDDGAAPAPVPVP